MVLHRVYLSYSLDKTVDARLSKSLRVVPETSNIYSGEYLSVGRSVVRYYLRKVDSRWLFKQATLKSSSRRLRGLKVSSSEDSL